MDNKKRQLLQRYQLDIVKDLDVEFVIDALFAKHAITGDEIDEIFNRNSRKDRARYLVETLLQNGTNSAFEAFVDCLAKNYEWLWKKLVVENNEPMLNESFEDSLSRGDVPRLPVHYVRRTALEKEIETKLSLLVRHKILALHGMSGSGKTSAAISVLRDNSELITNNFNGVVFWLNLANCRTEDDIIAQQNKLYRKASSIYTRNSHMNSTMSMSSFGSNVDSQSLSSYEWTWLELRDRLKAQFLEPVLKEALLVLDEVNDKLGVEAFDIGCKILVTTRDSEVVSNFHPQIIKVENSLKEEETLKLLASYVDLDVQKLPRQARKFHDACKGSPFNIGLIGAQLAEDKERLIHDNKRWNYYLKQLEKKDFLFLLRHNDNQMKTIEVCINSLEPNILPLFKMLAILPDNVKVSVKVLAKLWNKEISEVEMIMRKLRVKSLIIEMYDHDQRNYMYEVHDLIMTYLKGTLLSEEEKKKLHSDFLKSYQYDVNKQLPVEITDDGYIAFYIGYHILNTKNLNNRWSLFNKLYLDLKFLGNKVRLTGPADVILDLQKYETQIVNDELDRDLLCSIRAYISTHGIDLYRYPCTDIVQSILQHESKGLLYTKAWDLAQKSCAKKELYFEFLHEQDVEEIKHSTIDVKENISAVCFLGDYVLVGTYTGLVKFFHIPTNKLKKELNGTGTTIKWVGACPMNPPRVAALSFDGVIKMWYIDDVEREDNDDVIDEESEEMYNNNCASNCTIQPKLGPFLNCRWANHQEVLITHTAKMIILYNVDGSPLKVFDNFDRDQEILCCAPCNYDRYLIAAITSNGGNYLVIVDQTSKEKIMTIQETGPVLNILVVPGSNKIITQKTKEITEHVYKINYQNICNTCMCNKIIESKEVKDNLMFLTIAVNKTGTLLFASTDDSRIICIDLKTNSHIFDLENRRGNVVSMDVSEIAVWNDFEPGSDVLLTGTGTIENSAKVWNLDTSYVLQHTQKNGKVRLTKRFDVSFNIAQSPQTPSTTATNSTVQSASTTPKRAASFQHSEAPKRPVAASLSLDRHALKPLNLRGICSTDAAFQPLLAVRDDKNNIQVMRGRKVLTEIITQPEEEITAIKISPCNHYVIYGLRSGIVKKYVLRSKESRVVMDMNSSVEYLNFANPQLLIAGSKNCSLMAHRLTNDGDWKTEMMQCEKVHLGSQEILNDIQGIKKKNGQQPDNLSSSGSETSLTSKSRIFFNRDTKSRFRGICGLVECFWVRDVGLITVESNAVVKLWNQEMKLVSILNARQLDAQVTCAAFHKNVLAICDDYKTGFTTFELKTGEQVELNLIQDYRLNNRITSCDLSEDGFILAMGLDSGDVVVWNVPGKRQLRLIKHHKSPVHWCSFSPVPDRLYRSPSMSSPSPFSPPAAIDTEDDSPPLVLVTMASEIVWWNVTYIMKIRANKSYWRTGRNVVTPLASPLDNKNDLHEALENLSLNSSNNNFFFGNGVFKPQDCWKLQWKGKKYKEGSKNKEILACIKLTGMSAKKLCHDEKFSCFVTVDNSGRVHVMNVIRDT
ncbi:hypothetical protein ABMA28_002824 [Loxostege sticticalis]|uniref:CARD domain-containing protein n=1 Tax=Loxostege sticticalis TaxID=481309 RepID=A0ABD0T0S1_LOXSC